MSSLFQMPARKIVPIHVQREGRSQVCYMRIPGDLTLNQVADVVWACQQSAVAVHARTFGALEKQMVVEHKDVPRTVVRVEVAPGRLSDLLSKMRQNLTAHSIVSPVMVIRV